MENDDSDDVIIISDDSDTSVKDINENDIEDSASAKAWNIMFGEGEDEDAASVSTTNNNDSEENIDDDNEDSNDEDDVSMTSEEEDDEESETHSDCARGPVSLEDIHAAMKWAEERSSDIEELLHAQLKPFIKNKTIIQLQLYGLGELDLTEIQYGPLQLAIAFNLMNRFKVKYPEITMTSQDPYHVEEEEEYLRSRGIQVLQTREFSSEHFIQASTSSAAANISNSAFICYMIHGMHGMYENFLDAHWKAELLSRIIIIGNDLEAVANSGDVRNPLKLKEFAKLCDKKPLAFFNESLADICFGGLTNIYSTSEENAKALIDKFPPDSSSSQDQMEE